MEASINRAVLDRVVDAIGQTIDTGGRAVALETRLADLKLGRIGRMRLGLSLEDIFAIELPDDVLEPAATVADIVQYLARRYYRDIDISPPAPAANEVPASPGGKWTGAENWLRRLFGGESRHVALRTAQAR